MEMNGNGMEWMEMENAYVFLAHTYTVCLVKQTCCGSVFVLCSTVGMASVRLLIVFSCSMTCLRNCWMKQLMLLWKMQSALLVLTECLQWSSPMPSSWYKWEEGESSDWIQEQARTVCQSISFEECERYCMVRRLSNSVQVSWESINWVQALLWWKKIRVSYRRSLVLGKAERERGTQWKALHASKRKKKESDHEPQPLDETNIHPESYEATRK